MRFLLNDKSKMLTIYYVIESLTNAHNQLKIVRLIFEHLSVYGKLLKYISSMHI